RPLCKQRCARPVPCARRGARQMKSIWLGFMRALASACTQVMSMQRRHWAAALILIGTTWLAYGLGRVPTGLAFVYRSRMDLLLGWTIPGFLVGLGVGLLLGARKPASEPGESDT